MVPPILPSALGPAKVMFMGRKQHHGRIFNPMQKKGFSRYIHFKNVTPQTSAAPNISDKKVQTLFRQSSQ